jgi:hypothetical protein
VSGLLRQHLPRIALWIDEIVVTFLEEHEHKGVGYLHAIGQEIFLLKGRLNEMHLQLSSPKMINVEAR